MSELEAYVRIHGFQNLVICKPSGGLNDSLCMINGAWEHADAIGGLLIVDVSESRIISPLKSLFNFEHQPIYVVDDEAQAADLRAFLSGSEGLGVDLWETSKGGIGSLDFLRRVKLSATLRERLRAELSSFGQIFSAVHIRNTDYQTGFIPVLRLIKVLERNRPFFISTDSKDVENFARKLFRNQAIMPLRYRPDSVEPLHKLTLSLTSKERLRIAEEAILDLLLLASANRLYYTFSFGVSRSSAPVFSGYSRLARALQKSPSVMTALTQLAIADHPKKSAFLIFTLTQLLELVARQRHHRILNDLYTRINRPG